MPTVKLAWIFGAPFATGVFASDVVSEEHLKVVILIASTIVGVVGAVTWLKAQVREQILEHAKEDEARHEIVLTEIRYLRESLGYRAEKEG